MTIIQLTPGSGEQYCGNCLRDNALVSAWRAQGHTVVMVPLYLPLRLDEPDQSAGTPIFFGGLNVYLDHKMALFRSAPQWLRRGLASPDLLRWTGRFAAKTRPEEVADLTLSMLRGEHGRQAADLEELIQWLRTQPKPDIVCLSNALLLGATRRLRTSLDVPVVCFLAGEDTFVDAMPEPLRTQVWEALSERARDAYLFLAPTRYFAERMRQRMDLPEQHVRVVPFGLDWTGWPSAESNVGEPPDRPAGAPVLGYFARLCRDKGLDVLIEAFLELRRHSRVPGLRLKIGGACGPADEPFVRGLRDRLHAAGALGDVEFHPNLDRPAKLAFLRSLSVFSVPALYGEALGLYVLEAMAAGVPVVQPRHAGFPEVVETTGGGVLYEPGHLGAYVDALASLLLDTERRRSLALQGRQAVLTHFSADAAARQTLTELATLTEPVTGEPPKN